VFVCFVAVPFGERGVTAESCGKERERESRSRREEEPEGASASIRQEQGEKAPTTTTAFSRSTAIDLKFFWNISRGSNESVAKASIPSRTGQKRRL